MGDSMPTDRQPAGAGAAPEPHGGAAPHPPESDAPPQEWTAYLLDVQVKACTMLGSRLYAHLLAAAAEDVRQGGPVWRVLEPHVTRDMNAALPLRFMAAAHRLVLEGRAAGLARHFPSAGGDPQLDGAAEALRATVVDEAERFIELVGRPCQTNEVGRCAALVGGFLTVAAETRLPLRTLELGASAGLNLRWHRYRYTDIDSDAAWGEEASPVQLAGRWDVPRSLLDIDVDVVQSIGCDPRPIDPTTDDGRMSLTSSVWTDQAQRLARLRAALAMAADDPPQVAAARAVEWLPGQLSDPYDGAATVVFHSVVLQYMEPAERDEVVALLHSSGATATASAPLYWLRMEPENVLRAMVVRLTRWPGGDDRLLATAGAHGDPVRWRAT